MQMYSYVLLVVLAITIGQVYSARPNDEIQLTQFNQSYFIANETYVFTLNPQYQVPLQLYRHVIYTATGDIVRAKVKRALVQNKKSLLDLASEDYEVLSTFLEGEVPNYVRVNPQKRSLPPQANGVRVIYLAKKAALFVGAEFEETKKRASMQADAIPLGTGICLHVPFFTSCDNQQDLTDVKAAFAASTNAFRTEIDSYKKTNDLRANEMTNTLNRQRSLIVNLAQETGATLSFISNLASTTATNAAQIAHGDYIIHAQIEYLKRITNSLLRYTSALASTDPRSLVAQPSLTKLFDGYSLLLNYLQNLNDPIMSPIVDSRTFNWTEIPLPTTSVRNVVTSSVSYVPIDLQISISRGFLAVTNMWCNATAVTSTAGSLRCSQAVPGTNAMRPVSAGDEWIFGPFHQNHVGIYTVSGTNVTTTTFMNVVPTANVPPRTFINSPKRGGPNGANATSLFCVDFLGYKMLATFTSTPNMLNGITLPSNVSLTAGCNNYLFREVQPLNTQHFFLFTIVEGIVVPFYSNCRPDIFMNATGSVTQVNYLSKYPSLTNLTLDTGTLPEAIYTTYEINARHAVSSNCYMNLEPEWIGLSYYIPPTNVKVINNIPRGYKLNQFTINPAGQLSSSLEFLYTQKWAWVYKVNRESPNVIVVDEAAALDGASVLFNLDGATIVDESDSFYGEGNNGRDCIRYRTQYEYDITSCYYQNDQKGYSSDEYLAGSVQTTGIARYVNKFQFSLDTQVSPTTVGGISAPQYRFFLKPRSDADFSFFVDSDGGICPKLTLATSDISGCNYKFFYIGRQPVFFGTDPIAFSNNVSATITVPYTNTQKLVRSIYVGGTATTGGKDCMLLKCTWGGNADTSSVRVEPPSVAIVSDDDKKLLAKVNLLVDDTLNNTINSMNQVQADVSVSITNLTKIMDALNKLDFNLTKLVPYEDFTELRAQVDKMIGSLDSGSNGSKKCASGPFSAECFLKDAGNTIIVIVVVVVVALGGYFICVKLGVAKKLFKH